MKITKSVLVIIVGVAAFGAVTAIANMLGMSAVAEYAQEQTTTFTKAYHAAKDGTVSSTTASTTTVSTTGL